MRASLIESPDEHHWVLLDHRVSQLLVDTTSFRFQTWSLDGSAEVRLSAPFRLRGPGAGERVIDPVETASLSPILGLLRRRLASLTISRTGELVADFDGGLAIVAPPSARIEAWVLDGGGTLEGVSYRAPVGGAGAW